MRYTCLFLIGIFLSFSESLKSELINQSVVNIYRQPQDWTFDRLAGLFPSDL